LLSTKVTLLISAKVTLLISAKVTLLISANKLTFQLVYVIIKKLNFQLLAYGDKNGE
jgi:hypothetical protein